MVACADYMSRARKGFGDMLLNKLCLNIANLISDSISTVDAQQISITENSIERIHSNCYVIKALS